MYVAESLALDVQGIGLPHARTDKYCLVSVAEKVVNSDRAANMGVGANLDSLHLDVAVLNVVKHPLGQTKFGNAVHKHTAGGVERLEYGYGVALLNDCKYGYEVNEQRMIITLLKAPMNPDPQSDRGDHYFTYSLYPHAGNWKVADTLQMGLEMNNPAVVVAVNVPFNSPSFHTSLFDPSK